MKSKRKWFLYHQIIAYHNWMYLNWAQLNIDIRLTLFQPCFDSFKFVYFVINKHPCFSLLPNISGMFKKACLQVTNILASASFPNISGMFIKACLQVTNILASASSLKFLVCSESMFAIQKLFFSNYTIRFLIAAPCCLALFSCG